MEGIASTSPRTAPNPAAELSPRALAMERRTGVVERLRQLDRDVAGAAAARLRGLNDLRLEAEALQAGSTARQDDVKDARARVRFRESAELERRSVRFEAAAALRISEQAAQIQLELAKALCTELTATMDALTAGEISEYHARLVWEHACQVAAEARPLFEERAIDAARRLNTARLKGKLRDLQERLHPDTATERHKAAVATCDVWVDRLPDGMATLSAKLPAVSALAAATRIEDYARGIKADPAETRTLGQIRAEVAADFLFNGELGNRTVVPTVHVAVPALSLAGVSEELAILEGYGPIDLATARNVLADAPVFIRVVTHPVTGTVLGVDRYRPSRGLRDWLRLRDQTCRAPGCGRRADYCELDHTAERAAENGPTAFDNLAHLCINHHKVKTLTHWNYRHLDRFGTLEWTSPLGEQYITEPATRMRGAPHLDDAVRAAIEAHDPDTPPEIEDHIPADVYAELQGSVDAELHAELDAIFKAQRVGDAFP